VPDVDAPGLVAALRSSVRGEVRFNAGDRALYATDSSNYRQLPIGVVIPASVDDGVAAIRTCREFGAPVLSRGGGTSLAGQCCNVAVVLDWSKHCTAVVAVDADKRTAVVEPGIKLDALNEQLARHRLMYGPRPATHVSCTLGGMIGNNSCGSTAQVYGKVADNIRRLEVLTYDGVRSWVGKTSDQEYAEILRAGGRRAEVYRATRELRDSHLELIRTRFPNIPRRVSGYNLPALLPEEGFHLAKALVGSESTLVTVLRAELDLVPVPAAKALVVLGYDDIAAAADAVPGVLPHRPHQLEGLDDLLVRYEHEKGLHPRAAELLPDGGGWLFVEVVGDDEREARGRAGALVDALARTDGARGARSIDDPAQARELWGLREAALGAIAHAKGQPDAWPGWEDSAVPPDRLGSYLRDLQRLYAEFDYTGASIYGHFGQGCVHTRIPFDLVTAAGIAAMRRFVERAADIVVDYGESFSGEHGDGQARGELLPRMFGDEVVAAFGEFKAIWDPVGRMSPGKLVRPRRLDQDLRLGTGYRPLPVTVAFGYPDDGGSFAHATLRCVGVGKCRREDGGVMCPSYMVTGEERHSTRGRAHLLFEMMSGHLRDQGWRSSAVREALDLCLACKGCKSDCPVNVDMATYKAEFLFHHYARRLRPRAHYSMGWLPLLAAAASLAPRLVNALASAPMLANVAKGLAGVDSRRQLPLFADRPFTARFRARSTDDGRQRVVLWPDTFTNSFSPSVATAAAEVLTAAGLAVELPRGRGCCGLTWISTGQLDVAKRVLRRTVELLREPVRAGLPVVVLEPSCAGVFRADAPELLPDDPDVRRLADATMTLAECLERYAPDWQPPDIRGKAIVQTHCHQHAVLGSDADAALLRAAHVDAKVLDSGCCGLAGNFGFETGHYDVSLACAERVLLPAVRSADRDTVVLADGFSCRTQIDQANTGRRAIHSAELLALALRGELDGSAVDELVERPSSSPQATRAALVGVGAVAAAGAVLVGRPLRRYLPNLR